MPAQLPPTAQAIAQVIGRELTLKLARECRFRHVYVPFRLSETCWLARTIGYAQAVRLQQEFAGMQVPLATCRAVALEERDDRIRQAITKGTQRHVVAHLLGISISSVNRALKRGKSPRKAEGEAA